MTVFLSFSGALPAFFLFFSPSPSRCLLNAKVTKLLTSLLFLVFFFSSFLFFFCTLLFLFFFLLSFSHELAFFLPVFCLLCLVAPPRFRAPRTHVSNWCTKTKDLALLAFFLSFFYPAPQPRGFAFSSANKSTRTHTHTQVKPYIIICRTPFPLLKPAANPGSKLIFFCASVDSAFSALKVKPQSVYMFACVCLCVCDCAPVFFDVCTCLCGCYEVCI